MLTAVEGSCRPSRPRPAAQRVRAASLSQFARLAGAPCPVEFGGIDRIQLRDGLVREIRSYHDPALLDALLDHGQRRLAQRPRRIPPREQDGRAR